MSIVLKDGTELPALPDGFYERPYRCVGKSEMYAEQYFAISIDRPMVYIPDTVAAIFGPGIDVLGANPAVGKAYVYTPGINTGGWELNAEYDEPSPDSIMFLPMASSTAPEEYVLVTNCDILTVTSLSEELEYTVGTEIWRKSDENYRVTGGYMTSIANEARRLGGKTGGMLPAVTEATLRGVTAGGGDGPQLAPNERIYQVGNANVAIPANYIVISTTAT